MLQICDVRKQYKTGSLVQTALDGVNLTLRDSEFVAILGPSGSGKTTLLNVIGGLDRYDSGNLIINGISTEAYTDRDWDSYRNHTIGFVFQSYNLIPHQSVLSNVELALTISGISRSERKKRAKKALEDVGLGDQLHKRPNQMSGGQMQRVAIARALVNNPDILLADEPTGALDSETSVQVMELLKEVSKDRLVVMVTHNPELAEQYANRVVRVRDGKIISDSNPYEILPENQIAAEHKNMGRASMSFLTALSLSFNNLRTKKGRTILTAFAGSIGIIGIALILSLSSGVQKYIDKIQEDTLSNYPLTIQQESADMTAMLTAFGSVLSASEGAEANEIVEQQMIAQMFSQIGTNDLGAFKLYLEENFDDVENHINELSYYYGIKPIIYKTDTSEKIVQVNPGDLFSQLIGGMPMSAYMDMDIFKQMIENREMLDSQYDVLRGRWPKSEDEMIVVLSDPHSMTDYMSYTLGLKDGDILKKMISDMMNGQEIDPPEEPEKWTYDDLMNLDFTLVPASARYKYNEEYDVWEDMSEDKQYMQDMINQGMRLKIVGIVAPKEGAGATLLTPGVAYTPALTMRIIQDASESQIVKDQFSNFNIDVFTGKPFDAEPDDSSSLNFEDMISVDEQMLSSAFGMNVNESAIISLMQNYLKNAANSLEIDTTPAQQDFISILSELATEMLSGYVSEHADAQTGKAVLKLSDTEGIVDSFLSGDSALNKIRTLEQKYSLPEGTLQSVYKPLLAGLVTTHIASQMITPETPELPELPELPEATVPEATEATLPAITESIAAYTEDSLATPETETTIPAANEEEVQEQTESSLPQIDLEQFYAHIHADQITEIVNSFTQNPVVTGAASAISTKMMEAEIQRTLLKKLSGFGSVLMNYFGRNLTVDEEKIAEAFQFDMDEDQLRRLMEAMSGSQTQRTADSNLSALGYCDIDSPVAVSLYFRDFAAKESFMDFLDSYNEAAEAAGEEERVISYTDVTGFMMSSIKTVIDSVSYVLIAFVAVSLIVSSIMIGIITYISVMERTKEIGVLRAIGASKRNISQVFNAETFIIGLCSGLIGIGVSLLLIIPTNYVIYMLTDNPDIKAHLPAFSSLILVLLSMCLTVIGGLIPSKHAAKKDPVIALRSE